MDTTPIDVHNALAYMQRIDRLSRRLSCSARHGLQGDNRYYTVFVYEDGALMQACSTCEEMNALIRALEGGTQP